MALAALDQLIKRPPHSATPQRDDIDGLRALAVLPVLLFHAEVPGFSGGFVGVDVFYVISGYLITSIVLREHDENRFSVLAFYERRIRRIFPALFTVVAATLLFGGILLAPADYLSVGKSLLAMTLFVSNIYFKNQGGPNGYFGDGASEQPLLHTWTLSVEEQFYLLFPAALILLLRRSAQAKTTAVAAVTVCSFFLSLWLTTHHPIFAFYLLPSRAWELLIGAILAMRMIPASANRFVCEIAGFVGLILLSASVLLFEKNTPFPGSAALMPCLGTWLIIYSSQLQVSKVGRVLHFPPLIFFGLISYSLYLWHWPLLVYAQYYRAGKLSPSDVIAVIALSVALAFLSYTFVEAPFRNRLLVGRRVVVMFGVAATFISLGVALSIVLANGIPQRFSSATIDIADQNLQRKTDYDETCSNWKQEVLNESNIKFCKLGPENRKAVFFLGDSHTQQLYPAIEHLIDQNDFNGDAAIFAVNEGCFPAEHLNRTDPGFYCDSFTRIAFQRAEKSDIEIIFIAFVAPPGRVLCPSINGRCNGHISANETTELMLRDLSDQVHRLRKLGKKVIISLPFPLYDKSIPSLEIRNAVLSRWSPPEIPFERISPAMRDGIQALARVDNAILFDPRLSLCPSNSCITSINRVSIYKDQSHIAATQVRLLEGNILATLQRARSDGH
jgi:peptidoglycan/LPS O-acetylase OafA/YrhL